MWMVCCWPAEQHMFVDSIGTVKHVFSFLGVPNDLTHINQQSLYILYLSIYLSIYIYIYSYQNLHPGVYVKTQTTPIHRALGWKRSEHGTVSRRVVWLAIQSRFVIHSKQKLFLLLDFSERNARIQLLVGSCWLYVYHAPKVLLSTPDCEVEISMESPGVAIDWVWNLL